MADATEFTGFLYAASKDVLAVEALAHAGMAAHCETITFHCQQAAEKMLKNAYMVNGVVPPKSHDVGDLLAKAIASGWVKAEASAIQSAIDLTIFAVVARYETSPDISEGEARKAVRDCNEIASMLSENGYDSIRIETGGGELGDGLSILPIDERFGSSVLPSDMNDEEDGLYDRLID